MKIIKNAIQVLRQLYSLPLILLILFPIFVGFYINYELSNVNFIWVNLIWVLPLTLLFGYFQKKTIYRSIACLYFLIGIIEIGHWIVIGGPIRVNSALVIANTNLEETIGFFDLQATKGLLMLIPYTLLFIYAIYNPPKINIVKNKRYLLGTFMLVFLIFIGYVANSKFKSRYVPRVLSVSYVFTTQLNKYKKSLAQNIVKNVDANVVSEHPQVFVLILGESTSRNHMSLYGFEKKTTPFLDKRDDIIVFEDAVSGYSLTRESIPAMLSETNLENDFDIYKSIDLLDIFHSAGFKTYWLSNQSPVGIFDNIIGRYAKKCDHTEFVDATDNSALQIMLKKPYDAILLEPFIKVLEEDYDKKFIIINLMGTHSAYKDRYPPDFNRFKGNTSKEQTIAEYHNAMLYNDFIVDSLLTVLKSKTLLRDNLVASAIYLSDHGENLYDEMDRVGHSYADIIPKSNFEIPFFVWLSPSYIEMNPDKVLSIEANKNTAFVTDDLFHAIMALENIRSPFLIEKRSIFSKNFSHERLRILADGQDFDIKFHL